jgi:hypothetical protein
MANTALVRLLGHHETPDKGSMLQLLAALAKGNPYLATHHHEGDDILDCRRLMMSNFANTSCAR